MVNEVRLTRLDFLSVTQHAALSASKWVGKGQKREADDDALPERQDLRAMNVPSLALVTSRG